MLIESNIKQVINRLERYQRELPGRVNRVLVPGKYLTLLEMTATRTLKTLADTDAERALVPMFVGTLKGDVLGGGGIFFTMSSPQAKTLGSVAEAQGAFEAAHIRQYADGSRGERRTPQALDIFDSANIEAARQAVRQWVLNEKIIDERDHGASYEEIAERVLWIMGLSSEQRFGDQQYTEQMREAGAGLALRVQTYWEMAAQGGAQTSGMDPAKFGELAARARGQSLALAFGAAGTMAISRETAQQWLAAVLAAWRIALCDRLRTALQRELHTLKAEIWGLGQASLGI